MTYILEKEMLLRYVVEFVRTESDAEGNIYMIVKGYEVDDKGRPTEGKGKELELYEKDTLTIHKKILIGLDL